MAASESRDRSVTAPRVSDGPESRIQIREGSVLPLFDPVAVAASRVLQCRAPSDEGHSVATEETRMPQETPLAAVGHAIQLTAIGTLLNVLTNRLARVIDRARVAEGRVAGAHPEEQQEIHALLATLA